MEDEKTVIFAMRVNIIIIPVFIVWLILLINKRSFNLIYIPIVMSLLDIINIFICKNKLKNIKK
ncbi:hypothetical protein [Clostridium oceanicum]|uniref:Uncharacterized protein n=1 Tax=Clostridium oceanicum TaxID=1543 RepID=A0ABN1JEZ6_9CLOT